MEKIRELSQNFLKIKNETFRRYFIHTTPLKHRFCIILGERGVGKTTTLIQYLLDFAKGNFFSEEILYIPVDHFLVQNKSLYEITEHYSQLGFKFFAFDEIHKYSKWSMELKSIFDSFPDVRILASGSSALEIHKGSHDLSRRALVYQMYGLSFREFIALKYEVEVPAHRLDEILSNHPKIATSIVETLASKNLKIIKLFREYLEIGYYPYFRIFESTEEFKLTVEQNLHTTLESDLVSIYPHLTGNSIKKIKQLVAFIAETVPFTPNWQTIKKLIDIGDDRTLKNYFKYLEDAFIISSVGSGSSKLKRIEDSEKIYLSNSNQLFAFGSISPNIGTVRETFFLTSLRPFHSIATAQGSDFLVDKKFHIEIGGNSKNRRQIYDKSEGYLALDDLEVGSYHRVPLWLFGLLY